MKQRKLRWSGLVKRSSGLARTIMQGTVQRARRQDRQRKRWHDNVKEWTGLKLRDTLRRAEHREGVKQFGKENKQLACGIGEV
ncbi:UDP-glucuronosyltransferase 2a1-like [Plakobranchus ocellatus]|uniref:UDP-glucuronosyltransferase 2a1-like n=1 Tax=Plakobranchus ocellatus TaxID=259542 RepID=A0AAV3Z776_9GAST|nr:UDP-glucuronosyltransferase 2a1-like [Plakobranchus ocellatus]